MIADLTDGAWNWQILPDLLRIALRPPPNEPLPLWAKKWVYLTRKVTTKPGYYDPDEFPWTWEFQEIIRLRKIGLYAHPADGALCLCSPDTPGCTVIEVTRETVLKSSVTGFTEGFLNGIRWMAQNDPQNVIFAIDSKEEAGNINENRLQPSLRRLGEEIFTGDQSDEKRFLLNLRRMIIYFLGSYSEAAFANKMAEMGGADELEEHGDPNTVENLESRLKSAERPLLCLMSKPKMKGGPIDQQYERGTMCAYEIACPHCGHFQALQIDSMKFEHWKTLLGEWDFKHPRDPYFACANTDCARPIEEHHKRWFNDRSRRRWRLTNQNYEPGHVSFHISDYYGYHPDAKWRKLAVKYIKSKGDPEKRKSFRNHHCGLPYEIRASKTESEDILALRGTYKRGTVPWIPRSIILGGDVGQNYAKYTVVAFRENGEAAVIDWGTVLSPRDFLSLRAKRYPCVEDGKEKLISIGYVDAKYEKEQVNKACYLSQRWLWPAAGINADLTARSISANHVAGFPKWFKVLVFADRDAKSELYLDRITAWVEWDSKLKTLPKDDPKRIVPDTPRLLFPADLTKNDPFLIEHTTERLVEISLKDPEWLPHAAKQFAWKRKGPNHWGDGTKVALRVWRWYNRPADERAADED